MFLFKYLYISIISIYPYIVTGLDYLVAFSSPTNAGIPYSLATIAPCVISPPTSIINPFAFMFTCIPLNYDIFLNNLRIWIKNNHLLRKDAATKLGVSPGAIKCWLDGGIITISLYNKIRCKIDRYNYLRTKLLQIKRV